MNHLIYYITLLNMHKTLSKNNYTNNLFTNKNYRKKIYDKSRFLLNFYISLNIIHIFIF